MKKIIFLILLVISISIIAQPVFSIGLFAQKISHRMDFEPNLEHEFPYRFLADKAGDYTITVKGVLNESFSAEPSAFKNVKAGTITSFDVIMKLPDHIDKPGIHRVDVIVSEKPPEGGAGTGAVARAQVSADFFIRVLYPGKYIVKSLYIPSASINDTIECKVHLENWGKENIEKASASIDIFYSNDTLVKTLYTESTSIESTKNTDIVALLDTTGMPLGVYNATATITWDNGVDAVHTHFRIGSVNLKIVDYSKKVEKKGIMPFDIKVESGWNRQMKDVYAETKIQGQILTTPTITLNGWETKTLTAYLDTNNLNLTNYTFETTVFFEGQRLTEKGIVEIIEPTSTEKPKKQLPTISGFNLVTVILAVLIVIIIISNILIYLHLVKKEKRGKK